MIVSLLVDVYSENENISLGKAWGGGGLFPSDMLIPHHFPTSPLQLLGDGKSLAYYCVYKCPVVVNKKTNVLFLILLAFGKE